MSRGFVESESRREEDDEVKREVDMVMIELGGCG